MVSLLLLNSAGVGFTPHVISVKATFWNISALQNCWTRTLSVNRRVKYFIRGQVKATHFTLCSSPRIRLFSLLHHSNLPNVKGYCAGGDRRLLIYECVPVGSLEDHILENDDSNPGFRGWSYDQKSMRASYQRIQERRVHRWIFFLRLCSNLLDDFCATAVVDGQIIGLGLLDTARLADFIKSWDRAAKKYTAIEVQPDYEKLGLANVWQESWNAIMGKMTRLMLSLIRYTSFSFCLCESLTYSPRSR